MARRHDWSLADSSKLQRCRLHNVESSLRTQNRVRCATTVNRVSSNSRRRNCSSFLWCEMVIQHDTFVFVSIPSGFFSMGSSNRYSWESPRHQVWVDAFEIGRTAITRAEYGAFLRDTRYAEPARWTEPEFAGANLPAVGISWFAAVAYCEWRSALDGRQYRLPTEAEWEKACRGGLDGCEYAWGDQPPGEFEYFSGEWKGPRPVGEWRPNGY